MSSLEELLPALLLCHPLVIFSENLLAFLLHHYKNGTTEDKVFRLFAFFQPIETYTPLNYKGKGNGYSAGMDGRLS